MRYKVCTGALALFLALGMAACDDPAGDDSARVTLRLTDAPGDLSEANVQIRQVYLVGEGGDSLRNRLVLYDGGGTFNLLTLSGGATAELARDVVVPAGTYSQVRIVIGDATIRTREGATFSTASNTLQCPSCAQSGLKVKLPGGAVRLDEDTNVLLLDFDVSQSFGRQAGRSGRWVMRPVVTATRFETAGGITGTVSLAPGVTLPACGGAATDLTRFVPRATAGDVTLSGRTEATGAYRISFVPPGTYTLGFANAVGFANGDTLAVAATPSTPSVTVGSGGNAAANYSITSASCRRAG